MRPKTVTHARELSGAERAAVVILALGEETSRPLWRALDEEELRELSLAITNLGSVTAEVVEELLFDFVGNLSATSTITGSFESARRLLRNILPEEKADSILEEIRGPAGRTMWDKLANVSERALASYLKHEHPQTVAVILSRIRPDHAARVIACLPEMLGEDVINRMLGLGPVQKDVLEQIEQTLRTEFMASLSRTPERDPHESMAEIFNNFDRSTERRFISALESKNPAAAERIKALMFVFEDLSRLDSPDLQTVIRHADKSVLATALKGANETLRAHFFANMTERAAKMLRDDIEIMGPVRMREVDTAQTRIVEIAKRLADEGEIFLSKSSEDELVY